MNQWRRQLEASASRTGWRSWRRSSGAYQPHHQGCDTQTFDYPDLTSLEAHVLAFVPGMIRLGKLVRDAVLFAGSPEDYVIQSKSCSARTCFLVDLRKQRRCRSGPHESYKGTPQWRALEKPPRSWREFFTAALPLTTPPRTRVVPWPASPERRREFEPKAEVHAVVERTLRESPGAAMRWTRAP